jgi:tetratricopeptide (TPR) repeat protein
VPDAQRELVDRVMGRLLAMVETPTGYDAWPPGWKVIDDENDNAFATLDRERRPQRAPLIRVHRGLIENVAEMNEHRLAFVLGHELAHLTQNHVGQDQGKTELAAEAFSREQEIEADTVGMEFTLRAGFSYREALGAPRRFRELGHDYTSFEGIAFGHPSWVERIALLEADETQARLWQATSAFETGVFFLQAEQYLHAEICFDRLTREFPRCHEAWVNLGYARLMQYCDALEPDDLRDYGVGPLVVGGFYRRAGTLAPLRSGIDDDLWWDAVGALQKALTLQPDLLLAKANLALACLVHPSGRSDVAKAAEYYAQVDELLQSPEHSAELPALTRATLLANAWVGVYHADPQRGAAVLAQIDSYLSPLKASRRTLAEATRVQSAIDYTRAVSLASDRGTDASQKRRALELLEGYLAAGSSTSSWWTIAYDRYASLAKDLSSTPKSISQLVNAAERTWRPVTGTVSVAGTFVGLGESTRDQLESLGEPATVQPIAGGANLKRYDFPAHGLSVIAARRVVAIVLDQAGAAPVRLQRRGLAAESADLRIGMPRADLEQLLGDSWVSSSTAIIDERIRHQFYDQVGVAVRYREGSVSEIILVVPPRAGEKVAE